MDEESVFGPFTFRQTIYLFVGFVVVFWGYDFLEPSFRIPAVVLIIAIVISLIRNSPRVVIDESYIKRKRFSCKNLEEFQVWVKRKIAMIQAQIHFRATKGMPADPKFEKGLKMFEDALRDIR